MHACKRMLPLGESQPFTQTLKHLLTFRKPPMTSGSFPLLMTCAFATQSLRETAEEYLLCSFSSRMAVSARPSVLLPLLLLALSSVLSLVTRASRSLTSDSSSWALGFLSRARALLTSWGGRGEQHQGLGNARALPGRSMAVDEWMPLAAHACKSSGCGA